MEVSWTAVSNESGITYTVWYSTSSGTTTEPQSGASNISGVPGTSTTLSGLVKNDEYYIWVAAVLNSSAGCSIRVSQTTYTGILYSNSVL